MSLLSINSSFTLRQGIQSTWEWRQSATGKFNIFFKFSVLISFTSSPQECGYNFMYQSASNSLWRLKRRTWIWLIHIKVCTSKILFYILKISWGNWSILCVTNTNYHTMVANAMAMYFSLTLALVEYYDKNWGDLNTSREYMLRTWLTWRSDKRS